ncbi:hypothetical protein TNCV_2045591 [Trichonephila clavipes]|uniref:Uncharacterized protein n=1 Tax=Trichonephila clavipes TaxID=2585209 RepID=A0A8X6SQM3_TRICX|nr:hypothetical protein TNCV_2045591 [Trichonephila clavipes]
MVACGVKFAPVVRSGNPHSLVDAVTIPSYPRQAQLERSGWPRKSWTGLKARSALCPGRLHTDLRRSPGNSWKRDFCAKHYASPINLIKPSITIIWLDSVQAGGITVSMSINFALSAVCEWSWRMLVCRAHI